MDAVELFDMVSGTPGTPVPVVDPEDIKAIWEMGEKFKKDHPGVQGATGMEVLKRRCKPGAIVKAVVYRTGKIEILRMVAPEVMEPLLRDKLEAVIRVASEIPMEWIGVVTVHKGWPFDPDDFVRRVSEA